MMGTLSVAINLRCCITGCLFTVEYLFTFIFFFSLCKRESYYFFFRCETIFGRGTHSHHYRIKNAIAFPEALR